MTSFTAGSTTAEGTFDNMIEVSQGKNIVTDGPLSKMYTSALNELYAKEVDPVTGLSLETQAIDAINSENIWLATRAGTQDFANQGASVGMLYGVSKQKVQITDVINVADAFSEMTAEQKEASGIIIDCKVDQDNVGSVPTYNYAYVNPYETALEQLCSKHGVAVYPSLEAYLEQIKKG